MQYKMGVLIYNGKVTCIFLEMKRGGTNMTPGTYAYYIFNNGELTF